MSTKIKITVAQKNYYYELISRFVWWTYASLLVGREHNARFSLYSPGKHLLVAFIFQWIAYITVVIFIIDYLLRLFTADLKLNKRVLSFFVYPLTPMAIVDLLSILPSVTVLNSSLKLLKLLRLLRTLKVLRAFKFLRYSKSFEIIASVFKKQKHVLGAVATLAAAYVLVSALVIYNVEPDSFHNFFDAIYWATISLTTVGYGDIYPVSTIGRIVTMVSSVLGIAIVALPAGVITAGYMEEINKTDEE